MILRTSDSLYCMESSGQNKGLWMFFCHWWPELPWNANSFHVQKEKSWGPPNVPPPFTENETLEGAIKERCFKCMHFEACFSFDTAFHFTHDFLMDYLTYFLYVLTCSCWDAQSQGSSARPSWGICVHPVFCSLNIQGVPKKAANRILRVMLGDPISVPKWPNEVQIGPNSPRKSG